MVNIRVEPTNLHAPRLVADSLEGFVEENSPVGTLITSVRRKGQPLQLRVIDDDMVLILSSAYSLLRLCHIPAPIVQLHFEHSNSILTNWIFSN